MNERLRTVGRTVAYALGVLLVGCLLVAAVGYAANPHTNAGPVSAVDTDEPPSEVVADATAQLWVRDHTWEFHEWERNKTTDTVKAGIRWRVRVQHSQDRALLTQWDAPTEANETVKSTDQPTRRQFSRRYAAWETRDGSWHRFGGITPVYRPKVAAPLVSVSGFDNSSMTVVSENESALVVRTNDKRTLNGYWLEPTLNDITATFVVAKTDDPYLSRIVVREETNTSVEEKIVRVTDVDTTTAPKPNDVPSVTGMEIARRIFYGLNGLLS